jgi:hypothetical protein
MRERLRTTAAAAGLVGMLTLGVFAQAPQTPPATSLQLTFPAEGQVTLVATNVTVREILAEWTRLTGATFTNAEKMPAERLTVQYENMPQSAVVDSLLRSAAGYLLAAHGNGPAAVSNVATVYIIPTSQGTANAATAFQPQVFTPQIGTLGSPNDEIPPVSPVTEDQPPPQQEQPPSRPNQPTYLGTPGGIVPIVPVPPARGGGAGPGGAGGGTTPPPPPPPPPTGGGTGS